MSAWFECKVKYQKMDQNGKEKVVTEPYLIDAVSFTEAESRIHKELEPYISGEFNVTNIKIANFSELIPDEAGDRWFKCKVTFITLDEEKGVERKSNTYMLVQANNVKEAYDNLESAMTGGVSDFSIPNIAESPIMDVFPYAADSAFEAEASTNDNTEEMETVAAATDA
ncbi:MAG TPA: phage tail protein [Bacteroidales bacterium]|jgi:hypothetical protein|nr:phage tail protein [Bacteroidales bacterium]